MLLNLRQAIIQRVQDKTKDELLEVIEDSVGSEERSLPGLGVLFEMIWRQSDKELQAKLVASLKEHLETKEHVPSQT
jgi:small acid-soluble spore protein I (minor)